LSKVQLYVPPGGYFAERWSKGSSMPPLGLLSIGAVLEKEGLPVEIVPANVLGLGWKDIAAKNKDNKDASAKFVTMLKEGKGHPKVAGSDAELKALAGFALAGGK